MKKYIALLLWVALATACQKKQSGDHLSQSQMGKILFDVQLAEAYSTMVIKDTVHKLTGRNMDSLGVYYKEILAHHKVSEQLFNESLNYYREHPDELDSIYTKMLPEFEKLQAEYKIK